MTRFFGKNFSDAKTRIWLAGAVMFTVLCHFALDTPVAGFFGDLLRKNRLLSAYASDIPDILSPMAVLCTVASWAAYCWFIRKGRINASLRFFQLTGWTVPLSFLTKAFLKQMFGKVTTRAWLINPELYGFHWFDAGSRFNGFPSGHMAVFTVLVLAVWRFFPRYGPAAATVLLLLAAALIVTSYHFVSDVIAGALVGVLIDAAAVSVLFRKKEIG